MPAATRASNTPTNTGVRIHAGVGAISRFPGGGLGAKIFFSIVFVVVAALGGALFLTKRGADRAAEQSITRALAATQAAVQDALASRAQGLLRVTAGLAQVPAYVSRIDEALRAGDRAALIDQVEEFRDQTGADWTMLTDADGWVQAWTLDLDLFDEDFSDASFIRLALNGDSTAGTWIEPSEDGDLLFQVVGIPVFDPSKTTVYGVLLAALAIDETFAADLRSHTNSDVAFFSLDTLGAPSVQVSTVVGADLDASLLNAGIGFWPDYLDSLDVESGTSDTTRITMRGDNETLVGVAGALYNAERFALGGYVGFRSWTTELAAYTQLQDTIVVVFVAGVGLALVLSLILAGQITRPVNRLVALTNSISEGQYSGTIDVRSRDEIGQLASAFQHMMTELKAKEELVEFLSGSGGQTVAMTDSQATLPDLQGATVPMAMASRVLTAGMEFAGRYRIKEVLGAGGMGVVYRALDRELDEVVAIKTLKPEALAADASLMERFKQEIRLARRITHRNVVRTHDLGEDQGTYYITMEYVEGQTLKELIQARGPLPPWVTVTVGKQLARALHVAHAEGIVHRDVKPQNIVVDSSGFLKVMDFGIARIAARPQDGEEGLTAVGTAIGTPDYMAPEQMLGEEVDARADLYAAGIVLYECVTGRPAFNAPTIAALMVMQINDQPADPRTIVPDTPPALAELILKALEKNPADRWQSAREMIDALDAVPTRPGS